ncbi:MAG TPA: protein kinase [Terriglobales bacterium]|nr:protein kinase [Terriglobales bacterium]
MNPERWQHVKQIFDEALAIEPSQRTSFLDRSCDGDPQLRQEVDSLLDSHNRAGTNFLNAPAADLETVALPSSPSQRGRRIGVYEIVEQIGYGGMGEVFSAVRADGQYKKEVAVKLVRGGYDTASVLERFRNERQILASLDHPNIARLLDGGTADGIPYLVMELIEGQPIDRYCDEHELSVSDRLRLFRQVCLAVHYAHQHLVIHRDLKPSNVLVTEAGEPKLLDFGIAKIVTPINEAETTMTRAMTPEFASPEQIRGEPITTASDVYSLGVVLYRLLTGRSPYSADTRTPHKLAQAVCDTEPGRPSTVVVKRALGAGEPQIDLARIGRSREGSPAKLQRRLAGDLDDITMMALRKEPARRYASAEQFAEDIRRHLEGMPVIAARGSWNYRAEKFVKRHKLGISAAALITLAIAGGLAATIREARIAQANAHRAERRFNDVRHLANSLTFDVDKSIAALPNSTPARKLLVDNALQYLDALSQEAKGDISLQREVADAYVKLAEIQGNPFVPNLGDTNAALTSYRKAQAISESIVAADPSNNSADQLRVAFAHEMIGEIVLIVEGNPQAAMNEEMKAIAILEPLSKSDPHDLQVLSRLAGVYDSTGDIQSGNGNSANFGDIDLALEYRRKSLDYAERVSREKPNDPGTRRSLANSYMKMGRDLVKTGDRNGGLDSFRKALDLVTLAPNAAPSRNASVIYEDIANTYMMNGDTKSALLNYRNLIEIDRKLVEQDAKNATARVDIAYGTAFLGIGIAESGDVKQGLATLQEAIDLLQKEIALNPGRSFLQRYLGLAYVFRGQILFKLRNFDGALRDFKTTAAIHEKICAANPNDIDSRVALAAVNTKIAATLAMRGQSADAVALFRSALAVVEPLAHSPHPMLQAQYTAADAYTGLGIALDRQAQSSARDAQLDTLKQACSWSQQGVAEWQRVRNPGKYSPSGFETAGPTRAAQELSSCQAALKKHQEASGKH